MKFAITIRAKLLLLAGVLLAALVGSNLFLPGELAGGKDAIRSQGEVLVTLNSTSMLLREFGELKYWLADLQASWMNESEENAEAAKAKLIEGLATIESFAPDEVAKIKTHVANFVESSYSATDALLGCGAGNQVAQSLGTMGAGTEPLRRQGLCHGLGV